MADYFEFTVNVKDTDKNNIEGAKVSIQDITEETTSEGYTDENGNILFYVLANNHISIENVTYDLYEIKSGLVSIPKITENLTAKIVLKKIIIKYNLSFTSTTMEKA
ncbi:hypothetical protein [uncultured archaeal virus]|uniref:Uncharacterized protein n=1 Tax=uncultured archaeal virus TaxID=1960247 RepID=A0A8B0LN98_9VIRU|nr:hypothetical protein [uncultured archaeal virus]